MAGGVDEGFDRSAATLGAAASSLARAVVASAENPSRDDAGTESEGWSDPRPFLQQLAAYPATSSLVVIFIMVRASSKTSLLRIINPLKHQALVDLKL